jgi:hypothetical protein
MPVRKVQISAISRVRFLVKDLFLSKLQKRFSSRQQKIRPLSVCAIQLQNKPVFDPEAA